LIEPATTGEQVLLVIVNIGVAGITQAAPGIVVTELVGLEVAVFTSQLQRVKIVCAGPVWAYVGKVVFQVVPPFTEYCKVEPVGQAVAGTAMTPPATAQDALQALLVTTTGGAAAVKTGQQTTGAVAPLAFVLTQFVVVFRHLANTLMTEVV
jgi:hypothetical protein